MWKRKKLLGGLMMRQDFKWYQAYGTFIRLKDNKEEKREVIYVGRKDKAMGKNEEGKK